MQVAPIGADEDARLAALAQYALAEGDIHLDLGVEEPIGLARRLFDVPVVLVSLVSRERQFFPGKVGLDLCGTERAESFCAHAIAMRDVMVVPDALLDPRFADNPLVIGPPGIRFYAGAQLRSTDGHAIGTLCIIDRKPRATLTGSERSNLRALANLVSDRLEMRRLRVARDAGRSRFRQIAATSPDAILCADAEGRVTSWNASAEAVFGWSAAEAMGRGLEMIVPGSMRAAHHAGLARVAGGGEARVVGKTIVVNALRRDGTEIPVELSLSMWDEDGARSFGAIMRDITERRANEETLFRLAHRDALTELPNRGVLIERIEAEIAADVPLAVLVLDLDGFKGVNDTLGHGGGDALLKHVGERIAGRLRARDTVARLGGDEFAVLIPGVADRAVLGKRMDALLAAIAAPFQIDGQTAHVGASIGAATFPADAADPDALLSAADLAMYQAKAEGRQCRRFFTPALREEAVQRRAFAGELLRAFDAREFELHYQPQVRIADGTLAGAEALLRWNHPTQGLLEPGRFLPALEGGLLAARVGRWVLDAAIAQAAVWAARVPGFRMGINLFGAQFRTGHLAQEVAASLEKHGLEPSAIELEITENIILRHDETMLAPLKALAAAGVGIAFDDFGTGHASLSLLKRYPLTRIKIDRCFVSGMTHDPVDAAVVNALIYLARQMGVDVVAEGVETAAQRDLLAACGCAVGQGYLFGRGMPAAAFERMIASGHPLSRPAARAA